MTPYYDHAGITIYRGDALGVLAALPSASVDGVFTDPPYSSGGMVRGDRAGGVHEKYVQTDSISGNKLAAFSGDNRDQRAFGYWSALWIGETRRIARDGAVAAVFCDWRQLPVTTDAIQAGGYVWRGVVPWFKPASRPMLGRWTSACEYVVWGTKGPREIAGDAHPGFFQISPPRDREHITEKPVGLMTEMLRIVPAGGVVLDPFTGSGTTLVAAKELGLRAIGVEIEERFCEVAARRCAQDVLFPAEAKS